MQPAGTGGLASGPIGLASAVTPPPTSPLHAPRAAVATSTRPRMASSYRAYIPATRPNHSAAILLLRLVTTTNSVERPVPAFVRVIMRSSLAPLPPLV